MKAYIGYDLGNAETAVSLSFGDSISSMDLKLPGTLHAGDALISGYAEYDGNIYVGDILRKYLKYDNIAVSFKKRPTDLLPKGTSNVRLRKIEDFLVSGGEPNSKNMPELFCPSLDKLRKDTCIFTEVIFGNEEFKERLKSQTESATEIVFCIGRPSKWDNLDSEIYSWIFRTSILGQGNYLGRPSKFFVVPESYGAYLYFYTKQNLKDLGGVNEENTSLVIDVGSSTTDESWVTFGSDNSVITNYGHPYLGALLIDFMIEGDFKKDEATKEKIGENNYKNVYLLNCRYAKERLFSASSAMPESLFNDYTENIDTGSFFEIIKGKDLIDICNREINFRELGLGLDMTFESWQAEFKKHLTDLKNNQIGNRNVLCVILTGSASYMYFVSQIVKEVFEDTDIIYDIEPRNAIARGLSLTGPVREQAEMMHQELIGLENEVPEIINKNLDRLFDRIRESVTDKVYDRIINDFIKWKAGKIRTIQNISDNIKTIDIEPLINTEIDNWAEKTLVEDINSRAEKIFQKYSIPFKNDFQLSHISLGSNVLDNGINPYECIMNQFSTITGFIALGVIGLFVWGFFLLFSAFPLGLVFLGVAYGLFKLFDSENSVSEAVRNKILKSDIPMPLRNLITMNAIKEKISKGKIAEKIKEVFDKNKNENRKAIGESVSPIMKNILREKYSDVLYFYLNTK